MRNCVGREGLREGLREGGCACFCQTAVLEGVGGTSAARHSKVVEVYMASMVRFWLSEP